MGSKVQAGMDEIDGSCCSLSVAGAVYDELVEIARALVDEDDRSPEIGYGPDEIVSAIEKARILLNRPRRD